jgi:hypothetical protein
MATKLDKDVVRESTVTYDNREIIVTLTEDQKISFKLKGMKSGTLDIGIEELYLKLAGSDEKPKPKGSISIKKKEEQDNTPMISLHDLRTNALVTKMDLSIKLVLEALVCELLKKNIKL